MAEQIELAEGPPPLSPPYRTINTSTNSALATQRGRNGTVRESVPDDHGYGLKCFT